MAAMNFGRKSTRTPRFARAFVVFAAYSIYNFYLFVQKKSYFGRFIWATGREKFVFLIIGLAGSDVSSHHLVIKTDYYGKK